MITGRLLIHSALGMALFDSSRKYNFIAKTFVNRIGVSVEELGYNLVILILLEPFSSLECMCGVSLWLSNNASC